MCPPLPLSPVASLRLSEHPFLARDTNILNICAQEGMYTVADLLAVRFRLSDMFNVVQVSILHEFFKELRYNLEKLGLKKITA